MTESPTPYTADLHAALSEATMHATAALASTVTDLQRRVADLEQRATQRWPEWMPVSTAAAYCGRSDDWLRARIREGSLPVFVPAGTVERICARTWTTAALPDCARSANPMDHLSTSSTRVAQTAVSQRRCPGLRHPRPSERAVVTRPAPAQAVEGGGTATVAPFASVAAVVSLGRRHLAAPGIAALRRGPQVATQRGGEPVTPTTVAPVPAGGINAQTRSCHEFIERGRELACARLVVAGRNWDAPVRTRPFARPVLVHGGTAMAITPLLTDVANEEVTEAQAAFGRYHATVLAALADRHVSPEELDEIKRRGSYTAQTIQMATLLISQAHVALRVVMTGLRGGVPDARLLREAGDVGLCVAVVHPDNRVSLRDESTALYGSQETA